MLPVALLWLYSCYGRSAASMRAVEWGVMGGSLAWRRSRVWLAGMAAGALVTALLPGGPAAAASAAGARPGSPAASKPHYDPPIYRGKLWVPRKPQGEPSVGGHSLPADAGRLARAAYKPPREPGAVPAVPYRAPRRQWWPSGSGSAQLAEQVPVLHGRLTGVESRSLSGPQPAGALPVTITASPQSLAAGAGTSAAVKVALAPRRTDEAAGVSGLLMKVSGGPGQLRVRLDYSRFAKDYGGSWASRLKLVALPACALSTPRAPACRMQLPLPGGNDGTHSVWASVQLGTTPAPSVPFAAGRGVNPFASSLGLGAGGALVLAAVSTPGGAAGDYAATSLNPEGSWTVQEGNFSYDYPISVPPSLGGDAPAVSLDYSSETIDGETSAQNPQGSQIGDGWTYSPGFIEQSYEPCSMDSAATSAEQGDNCWDGYNATLSLAGHSGVLIGSGPGSWHLQNDDGTKVQLLTGGSNGMWNNEYWVVTTTDGTKYYFGADHVPGDSSSSLTTNSAWNEPVYCPASTDACYSSSTGSSSWTQLPYRWNLDYVVDPDNNLTVYEYASETNYYMRGGSTGSGTLTSYIRDGYLTTILYGWQLKDATASPAVDAADKIVFTPSPRCLSSCSTVTASAYPDVPTDQICASGDKTCDNAAPTFFSEERLTGITTYALKSQSSGTYDQVDSYALAQSFLTGTGETTAVMGLNSITHTGQDGTAVALPPTTFTMTMMDNRVLGTTQPALYRPRVIGIATEAGAQISVDYNAPECSQGSGGNITDADAPTNTMTCYPAYWAPPSEPDAMDWFNYYTVSQVEETDETGANSDEQVSNYTYPSTGVAWHYDESPTISSKYRTWDEYRGYLKVETTTGMAPDPVTEAMTWYMRGMNGDANGSGGTTSVNVSDSLGDSYADNDYLAGQVLETDTYTAAGGTVDSEQLDGPWTFNQTASMTPPSGSGLSTMTANMLAQAQVRTRRLLANGNWQANTGTTYFNGNGQVVALDDAPAGLPELCTATGYATPPSGNPMMEDYADRVTTVTGSYSGGSCPAGSSSNIVTDTETYYDDESATTSSLGTLGSLASPGGFATGERQATTWPSGGSETWQPESATLHDGYGRIVSEANADGQITTTSFSPATEQLPTAKTVTNPMGWKTVYSLDQARQLPLTITDPNEEVTTETYDALGRLTAVVLPIDQGGDDSFKYAYNITGTGPPSVTTSTLREDGSYSQDVKIYDGMLQLIQEQQTTANNATGRLITDTSYDSHGWTQATTPKPFFDSSSDPDASLFVPTADEVPAQTVDTYDGQGRITASAFWSLGVQQWQTTDSYPGMDETISTPPSGGTKTAVITNSVGQKSQTLSYTDSSGDTDTTSYAYTPAGQLATVSDNNSNSWSYTYNLLGQQLSSTDPGTTGTAGRSGDEGSYTYTYDGAGNLLTSTDPAGQLLTYTYDSIGRKLAEYAGTVSTGTKLASWTYDKTPINGGSTDALGEPTASTSYDSKGDAYTETITGYNTAYETTGTSVSIPSDQGLLVTGTTTNQYTTTTAYTPRTGLAEYTSYSADGGLPAETVYNTYDEEGLLTQFGNSADYLDNVTYSPQGQITSTTFGPNGDQLVQDYTYDAGTARTLQSITNLQTLDEAADTTSYTYDDAGNITSTSDVQNTGGTQTQCYTYNDLNQLTAAWTDTGGTSTAGGTSVEGIGGCDNASPAAANIGGPAPYWETYSYDLLGDRTSETTYDTALPASQDTAANATTQEVEYPGGNLSDSPSSNAPQTAQAQPDSAASILTSSPGGTTTTTPTYNADGGLVSQATSKTTGSTPPAGPPGLQKVSYDPQGWVSSVTTSGGTTSYTYDADGNVLLQADPHSTTLYIDNGAEQITLTGSTLSGLRFLNGSPDGTVVVESSAGSDYYETTNQQHTALEAISAASLSVTRRYFDPWGNPVGSSVSWPDNNAFLGKPEDPNTSLVELGSRQYDPATGAFISLDVVLEAGSPQQMGGYSYAGDNPVTDSDPNGTCLLMPNGHCYVPPPPSHSGGGGGGGDGGSTGTTGYPPPLLTEPVWVHYFEMLPSFTFPVLKKEWHFQTPFASVAVSVTGTVTAETKSDLEVDLTDKENPTLNLTGPRGTSVFINSNAFSEEEDASQRLGQDEGVMSRFTGGLSQSVFSKDVDGTDYDVTISGQGASVSVDISATRDVPGVSGHLDANIELTPRVPTPKPLPRWVTDVGGAVVVTGGAIWWFVQQVGKGIGDVCDMGLCEG
jgi:RHS repeat-associated protein